MTLVHRPFPARLRPADLGGLANMGIHRVTCVTVFILMLLSIILHAAPEAVYTIVTKASPPHVHRHTRHVGQLHVAALVFCFLAVGSMRRGPKLRAGEAKLGTAFGVRSAPPGAGQTAWNRLPLDMDDDPALGKVIDYGDCSMLTFMTLGYVSGGKVILTSEPRARAEVAQGGPAHAVRPAKARGVGEDQRERLPV